VARLLVDAGPVGQLDASGIDPAPPSPDAPVERTAWGDARRLPPPLTVDGAPLWWSVPAGDLGSSAPEWTAG